MSDMYISGSQAAEATGLSLEQITDMVKNGHVDGVIRGRGVRVNPASLGITVTPETGTKPEPEQSSVEQPQPEHAPIPQSSSNIVGAVDYWCGTLESCPVQNLSLGGVEFERSSENVSDPSDGSRITQREKVKGKIIPLLPHQVEEIFASAERSVVRKKGNRMAVIQKFKKKLTVKDGVPHKEYYLDPYFVPQHDDRPIGEFVYMIKVSEAGKLLGPMWQKEEPAPLLQARTA